MPINRLTAYKVWVSDLVTSPYIKMSGEFESNYVEVKEKQVSRVNIIGTIVNKLESGDKNYTSLVLDDGSEQIRIKAWREDVKIIERFNIGECVLVIGKVKNYNDETYILPEIVKQIDINWELSRKLELLKSYGRPIEHKFMQETKEEAQAVEEITFSSSNLRNDVLNLIEKYEEKSGITLEELKTELHKNIKEIYDVVEELIKEGHVYNIGNKYRLLV